MRSSGTNSGPPYDKRNFAKHCKDLRWRRPDQALGDVWTKFPQPSRATRAMSPQIQLDQIPIPPLHGTYLHDKGLVMRHIDRLHGTHSK